MSTPTRHAPTRRTVLRAAAWTAPAVSIAVAAPAFATSHLTPPGSASTNGSTRDGQVLNLKSLFTAGPQQVTGLQAVVTVGTGSIGSITVPTGWTRTGLTGGTATFTYSGGVAAGSSVSFEPVVTLTTNPTSTVTSTIAFTWPETGTATVTIPLAYVPPVGAIAANGTARKYNDAGNASVKHVEWSLTLTNTGTQTLTNLNLDFSWSADTAKNPATSFAVVTPGRTWNTTLANLTAALAGTDAAKSLAPNQSISITADFVNRDNSSGFLGVDVFSGPTRLAQLLNVGY